METKKQNSEHPKPCVIANPIYDTVFKALEKKGTVIEEQTKTLEEQDRQLAEFKHLLNTK
ncbi:MAG: hypothetical protein LBC19_10940 [Tannerella sp.]|jgi:hypothetical protein|nr:hypothetical protein [Tannerella sp.]